MTAPGHTRTEPLKRTAMQLPHLCPVALLALTLLSCSETAPQPPSPSADLSPREVVETVLTALRTNDDPVEDAGIATAYAFAAPGNRAQTGPLPRFTAMVRHGYAPLLNHRTSEIGPPVTAEGRRMFPVRVYPAEGAVRLYLFVLAQSDQASCQGCWLTEAVIDRSDQLPPEVAA